jgi:hypothetical protein
MTVLAVEADRAITGGDYRRLPSASASVPFSGSALSYGAGGYVHRLVAGELFAGFAKSTIQSKDAATADGGRYIEATGGVFLATLPVAAVTVADIGTRVYATDDNTFTFTQTGAESDIGRVVAVQSSTLAIVECRTQERLEVTKRFTLQGAGAAYTASSTRTLLAGMTIKAGSLRVGSRIRVRGQVIRTAVNSTDTLLVDLAMGATVVKASAATNGANNDILLFDADIIVRTNGASGTMVAAGHYTLTEAAADTAVTKPFIKASTTLDTTADMIVGLYGTHSTTNAGNSARCDVMSIDLSI